MNKLLMGVGATLLLGGCAGSYGPGPYAVNGPPLYEAYYDGGYGGFYDGYWGAGDIFYYSRAPRGRYYADRGGHFRHNAGPGGSWNQVRGRGPQGGRFRGGGRHRP